MQIFSVPDFQNYLRTQAGNTTTVNVIICTVDYLLRLQESIMDFYWHYSGKDMIDEAGKESFLRAITVAAQVFASITEFIQVRCIVVIWLLRAAMFLWCGYWHDSDQNTIE